MLLWTAADKFAVGGYTKTKESHIKNIKKKATEFKKKMSDKYPDSYLKMSKKIAQLTKVIFHLHTRNEENEEFVKAVRKAYEREIDSVVRDANHIISKQKEAIQAQKDAGDLTAKLREMQEKHEAEKKQFLGDLERYKSQVEAREGKLCADKEEALKQLKVDVESLKEKYEAKLKAMSGVAKGSDALKKTIEEMKRLHQIELENHVKESNKKYNDLLKEKLLGEDKLREAAEKEKAELVAKYEKQIKELLKKVAGDEKQKLESMLEQQKKEFEKTLAEIKAKLAEKDAAVKQLNEKLSIMQGQLEAKKKDCDTLTVEKQALENELSKAKETVKRLEKGWEEHKRMHTDEVEGLKAKLREQIELISNKDQEIKRLKATLADLQDQSAQSHGKTLDQLREKEDEIKALVATNTTLKSKVAELEEALTKLREKAEKDRASFEAEIADLKEKIKALQENSSEELKNTLKVRFLNMHEQY